MYFSWLSIATSLVLFSLINENTNVHFRALLSQEKIYWLGEFISMLTKFPGNYANIGERRVGKRAYMVA